MISIANPVHSFNAPKIVIDFVKNLPKVEGIKTFVINSCGEYNPINFASSNLLIKILSKKGFDVFYFKQFTMPNNFIFKFDEEQVVEVLEATNKEIPQVVNDIINCIDYQEKSGFIAKILSFIGRLEVVGAKWTGIFLYTNKSCNHCLECVQNCPNRNIIRDKNRIRFKNNCGLCMRCIYICPQNAIKFHQPIKFFSFEKWYENEEIPVIRKK
jgi:ferredoxin